MARLLWVHFFNQPIDTQPTYPGGIAGIGTHARGWFMGAQWFEVYDLAEAVAENLNPRTRSRLAGLLNSFLEGEQAAYRLVDVSVLETTEEEQIVALEDALKDSSPLVGVRAHLSDAIAKLSDRKAPDYRNAIKEAISAVEGMCQALTGDRGATLGQALKRLGEAGITLHPALEQAWTKLYGYTSDSGGIRHALVDEPSVTHAEAQYMVVTCSAFVSHLVDLAAAAHIELKLPK